MGNLDEIRNAKDNRRRNGNKNHWFSEDKAKKWIFISYFHFIQIYNLCLDNKQMKLEMKIKIHILEIVFFIKIFFLNEFWTTSTSNFKFSIFLCLDAFTFDIFENFYAHHSP